MRSPLHTSLFVAALLVLYLVNGLIYLPRQSVTYDGRDHGYSDAAARPPGDSHPRSPGYLE